MRGVPVPSLWHLHGSRRTWRETDRQAVVLAARERGCTAGTAGGRSPGCRAGQPPRRRTGVRRTRRSCRPL